MDDDAEKRFPRISLWEFLKGIFGLLGRAYLFFDGYYIPTKRRKRSTRD
jgi:hypothetical protein